MDFSDFMMLLLLYIMFTFVMSLVINIVRLTHTLIKYRKSVLIKWWAVLILYILMLHPFEAAHTNRELQRMMGNLE